MNKLSTQKLLRIMLWSIAIAFSIPIGLLCLGSTNTVAQIGDSLGGISGTLINTIVLVFVYLSFRHQFSETEKNQEERNDALKTRHFEIIRDYISQFHKNFDAVDFDKAWDALNTSFKQMQFGDYAQDWGEALHHNTTSDKVDETYRESLSFIFGQTEDGRNYWHAINIGHYIVTRLKESERFHAEHHIFLSNEFTLTYRITGLNYARRIRELSKSIKYKQYDERVFKESQFYKKLTAIDVFCNQKIPGTEI